MIEVTPFLKIERVFFKTRVGTFSIDHALTFKFFAFVRAPLTKIKLKIFLDWRPLFYLFHAFFDFLLATLKTNIKEQAHFTFTKDQAHTPSRAGELFIFLLKRFFFLIRQPPLLPKPLHPHHTTTTQPQPLPY